MAISKNMEFWQIQSFLENEVKEQIFLEISPILYIGQDVGGYFGVTRHILCFFDFLSALYSGYDGKDTYRNGAMKISKPENVKKFMDEVLIKIDPMYKENGKYLYAMYRHGLIHLYQPRTIKLKNGRLLKWAAYKGSRERAKEVFKSDKETFAVEVRHLGIITDPRDESSDLLTVSINCLFKDLLSVIDLYKNLLEQDQNLIQRWQSAANFIDEPESYKVISKD